MDTHLELEKKIAVLKAALEKATKALEKYENTVLPSTNTDLRFFAKEALAEIAAMLDKC